MTMQDIKTRKLEMMRRLYENKSSHVGSCLSVFEILAASLNTCNNTILSKAHANYAYQVLTGGDNTDDHVPGWGSLGYGLSIGAGMALAYPKRSICIIAGDGEMNEGTMLEAAAFIGSHNLRNVSLVIDNNGLQGMGGNVIKIDHAKTLQGMGWETWACNGHDYESLCYHLSYKGTRPNVIIADTIKGHGVTFMEHRLEWHYKSMTEAEYQQAIGEINEA